MKKCEVCGSTNRVVGKKGKYGKDLCEKHRAQMKQCGHIKDRTIHDRNELILNGDYLEIVIRNQKGFEICKAIVDSICINIVKDIKWHISNHYVSGNNNGKKVLLHRLITDCPENMVVDHISHNKLDNRLSNLRICTRQQNRHNQVVMSSNKTGYTGVNYVYKTNKWIATISVDYKKISLGTFTNIKDAIIARKKAEIKYFKEFTFDKTEPILLFKQMELSL